MVDNIMRIIPSNGWISNMFNCMKIKVIEGSPIVVEGSPIANGLSIDPYVDTDRAIVSGASVAATMAARAAVGGTRTSMRIPPFHERELLHELAGAVGWYDQPASPPKVGAVGLSAQRARLRNEEQAVKIMKTKIMAATKMEATVREADTVVGYRWEAAASTEVRAGDPRVKTARAALAREASDRVEVAWEEARLALKQITNAKVEALKEVADAKVEAVKEEARYAAAEATRAWAAATRADKKMKRAAEANAKAMLAEKNAMLVEKNAMLAEKMAMAKVVAKANAEQHAEQQAGGEKTCVVCMDKQADYVIVPCGHLCICADCIRQVNNKCPICRITFSNHYRVYIS